MTYIKICYFLSGTIAYDKMTAILMNKRFLSDIEKLSGDAQTSCLEAFNATLNNWNPKMVHCPWAGKNCRFVYSMILFDTFS